MRNDNITRLTLAGMFAALAFVCFTYLRIEIPMGGGMTGKIYIGHAFYPPVCSDSGGKIRSAYRCNRSVTCRHFSRLYHISTADFLAKFLLGLAVAFIAHKVFNLAAADDKKSD